MIGLYKVKNLHWQSMGLLSEDECKQQYDYLTKTYPNAIVEKFDANDDNKKFIFIDNDRSWEHWLLTIKFKDKADEAEFILREHL